MADVTTRVAEVRRETPDGVTLRLDLQGTPFPFRPGQFILVDPRQFPEVNAASSEPPRGFSISSDGLDPGAIEITVKEDPHGLLSPWLVRGIAPGREVRISGPKGRYGLPDAPPPQAGFLHLCAGSGVAPNRGMIRAALGRGWPQRHLLVLQNRAEVDVFFRDDWPRLVERHPDKLRVRHVFSVAGGEHVSVELLRREMAGWIDGVASLAYVCGPNRPRDGQPGFLERWSGHPRRRSEGWLMQLGFEPERVVTESW